MSVAGNPVFVSGVFVAPLAARYARLGRGGRFSRPAKAAHQSKLSTWSRKSLAAVMKKRLTHKGGGRAVRRRPDSVKVAPVETPFAMRNGSAHLMRPSCRPQGRRGASPVISSVRVIRHVRFIVSVCRAGKRGSARRYGQGHPWFRAIYAVSFTAWADARVIIRFAGRLAGRPAA
jgi:hypothetical protein